MKKFIFLVGNVSSLDTPNEVAGVSTRLEVGKKLNGNINLRVISVD